ncbi:hypothetical protein UC35_13535 [Ramlibacter tataouinensis]|uniref:Uncharacterized protein n=1 Tax=Ramlibacter tataouinensis TaxID=94132 RepID=A0A127JUW7_9BURK|nr:hypothetical protein UC35_13535 [Ramlibacter tataouinensis]
MTMTDSAAGGAPGDYARRIALIQHMPPCPKCAGRHVHLIDWLRSPAEWWCDACKFEWAYEPALQERQLVEGPPYANSGRIVEFAR